MRNYSSKQSKKGRTAYRTPSRFISKNIPRIQKVAQRVWDLAARMEQGRRRERRK